MAVITTRAGKGSPLTNAEVDANFTNLNAEITLAHPTIRPSLLLDFANVGALDPRITFARASSARYYDGRTSAKAEENLLLQSQTFGTTWTRTALNLSSDSSVAPDGTTTADTISGSGTTGSKIIAQSGLTTVSGQTFAFSVFVKAGTNNFVQLVYSSESKLANFDVATGVVGTASAGVTSSISPAANGYYRCVMVYTTTAPANPVMRICLVSSSSAALQESNSLTTSLILWGAQFEFRSNATVYTATTTAQTTNYVPVLLTATDNVARFQHDPITCNSLGLFVEPAGTNKILQSEDFGTTWAATRATVLGNQDVAPDGTQTVDILQASADNNTHFVSQTFTGTSSAHTFSVYVKAFTSPFVALRLFNGSTEVGLAYYNLISGSVGAVLSGSATISSVGNGWYRCTVTASLASSAACTADIYLAVADNVNSFPGNNYYGVGIWGAQVEVGSSATSYIATTTTTATRSADAVSMTGANFTGWYRQDQGTLYAESITADSTSNAAMVAVVQGPTISATVPMQLQRDSTASRGLGNGILVSSGVGSFPVNTFVKQAFAVEFNNAAISTTGAAAVTDSATALVPQGSELWIGGMSNQSSMLNGTIKKIAYYPKRLSNAELQAITSA